MSEDFRQLLHHAPSCFSAKPLRFTAATPNLVNLKYQNLRLSQLFVWEAAKSKGTPMCTLTYSDMHRVWAFCCERFASSYSSNLRRFNNMAIAESKSFETWGQPKQPSLDSSFSSPALWHMFGLSFLMVPQLNRLSATTTAYILVRAVW